MFTMMMFHDIVNLVQQEGSSSVTDATAQEIQALFGNLVAQTELLDALTTRRLNELASTGSKIASFCEEFGNGYLLHGVGDIITPTK